MLSEISQSHKDNTAWFQLYELQSSQIHGQKVEWSLSRAGGWGDIV